MLTICFLRQNKLDIYWSCTWYIAFECLFCCTTFLSLFGLVQRLPLMSLAHFMPAKGNQIINAQFKLVVAVDVHTNDSIFCILSKCNLNCLVFSAFVCSGQHTVKLVPLGSLTPFTTIYFFTSFPLFTLFFCLLNCHDEWAVWKHCRFYSFAVYCWFKLSFFINAFSSAFLGTTNQCTLVSIKRGVDRPLCCVCVLSIDISSQHPVQQLTF